MEIQQSAFYASYIRKLGWTVEKIDRTYIYIKRFPILGSLVKIQRPHILPRLNTLVPLLQKYHTRSIAIEPDARVTQQEFSQWISIAKKHARIHTDYFLPTKTILIDLKRPEQELFTSFSEAKRRGIRRAAKLGVTINITKDIRSLLSVKAKSAGFLGRITTHGQDILFAEAKNRSDCLLAYDANRSLVGGVLMLYWNSRAYYWIAGATKKGKRLFAPTLLVWEAVKNAKLHGCTVFDFLGVWDERMPDNNTEWKGFTKFKEGFGGIPLYYPVLP